MEEEIRDKIRPIYCELQGYLFQAPGTPEKGSGSLFFENAVWERYNKTIDELNDISSKDYSGYKVSPEYHSGFQTNAVGILDYRTKLGGLIARLHGENFPDETVPFGGMPSTIITQTQQQTQSFQIQMLLEIQSRIDEKIPKFDKDSKERNFLEKIKSSLSSVKDVSQLITLLLKTGNEIGLTISQILNMFK